MKVAVVMTGHMRGGLRNFPHAHHNFFSHYDVDTFIGVWDQQEGGEKITPQHLLPYRDVNLVKYEICDIDEYNRTKTPCMLDYDREYSIDYISKLSKHEVFARFMIQSEEKERGTHCGFGPEAVEYWANRIKDQYYMVKRASKLVEDFDKYDLVVRLRFDFLFLKPLILEPIDGKMVVATNTQGNMHYDCIQYGPPKIMKKYFLLHDHIDNFIGSLNYLNKFSYERFNAENMMKHYMEEHGDKKYELFPSPSLKEHVDFILQRG